MSLKQSIAYKHSSMYLLLFYRGKKVKHVWNDKTVSKLHSFWVNYHFNSTPCYCTVSLTKSQKLNAEVPAHRKTEQKNTSFVSRFQFKNKMPEARFLQQSIFLLPTKWITIVYGLFGLSAVLNVLPWPLFKTQCVLSDKVSLSTSASTERWGEQDKAAHSHPTMRK